MLLVSILFVVLVVVVVLMVGVSVEADTVVVLFVVEVVSPSTRPRQTHKKNPPTTQAKRHLLTDCDGGINFSM